jgi:hypothetical protein
MSAVIQPDAGRLPCFEIVSRLAKGRRRPGIVATIAVPDTIVLMILAPVGGTPPQEGTAPAACQQIVEEMPGAPAGRLAIRGLRPLVFLDPHVRDRLIVEGRRADARHLTVLKLDGFRIVDAEPGLHGI